jgi:ribonuclease P/MRP protein subunit RPP1
MMFADLCLRTTEFQKAVGMAKRLGLGSICLAVSMEDLPGIRKLTGRRDWRLKPHVSAGLVLSSLKPGMVRQNVQRVRSSAEIVVALGGTEELNRAILETPEIDVILGHCVGGRSGINHVLARLAKANDVAIGFDMNAIMTSYRLGRVQEFNAMMETASVVRKFGSPFVLTSGARDVWDMRSPSEIMAFGKQLGFSEAHVRKGLSDGIVKKNRKRLSGKWVMPGVEIE